MFARAIDKLRFTQQPTTTLQKKDNPFRCVCKNTKVNYLSGSFDTNTNEINNENFCSNRFNEYEIAYGFHVFDLICIDTHTQNVNAITNFFCIKHALESFNNTRFINVVRWLFLFRFMKLKIQEKKTTRLLLWNGRSLDQRVMSCMYVILLYVYTRICFGTNIYALISVWVCDQSVFSLSVYQVCINKLNTDRYLNFIQMVKF